jgi:tetratricopeptide (TPR) repeat protein
VSTRKIALLLLGFVMALASCKTISTPKRAINDPGMMYAMVYDAENTSVNGVSVYINGKKYVESDIQGRFILELKKNEEYSIQLSKKGYEDIQETFAYDPMNVLHFRMVNANHLIKLAETSLNEYSYGEAERYLNRALTLEPHRIDALYLMSITLYLQQKKAEARTILERLQSIGVNEAYVTELLAKIEEELSTAKTPDA